MIIDRDNDLPVTEAEEIEHMNELINAGVENFVGNPQVGKSVSQEFKIKYIHTRKILFFL